MARASGASDYRSGELSHQDERGAAHMVDITEKATTKRTAVAAGITATVRSTDRTGVEMEALTAVSVAALTLYDMIKAVDPGALIDDIRVLHKEGGRRGTWTRR